MCGICGSAGRGELSIQAMNDAIFMRGPDEEGFYSDEHVKLAMRRLRIIDLSTGSQPMYNENRSVVVVHNGEIYNFKELRERLLKRGHALATHSDTEVLVHLYEEYGENFVKELRGMFAFALWDLQKKKLFIGVDRFAIKPLYYCEKEGTLLFASEVKSILQSSIFEKKINFHALHDYLSYTYVSGPATIFEGLKKIPSGTMLIWDQQKGKAELQEYWNGGTYLQSNELDGLREEELCARLDSLLKESIELHLNSDVPLGIFLSGGLDSGSIVALASEVYSGKRLKTFSIGFEEKVFNELELAGAVAKKFNTEHHEYIVKAPSLDEVEEIVGYFDEPFADSSALPTYFVSKMAKEQITVALSGDGGDEIFGGYGNYRADKIGMVLRKIPRVFRNLVLSILDTKYPANGGKVKQIKKLLKVAGLSPEDGHLFWLSFFSDQQSLYRAEELTKITSQMPLNRRKEWFEGMKTNDFLNKCMFVDMKSIMVDDYLTKVDRMSMANSLEVRVPFLDHKLVEFSLSLPSKFKVKGLTTKYLLRKIMKDRLPPVVMEGKKKGFSVPLEKWFQEDFSVFLNRYLSKEWIKKRGYFEISYVESLKAEHLSGKKDNSKILWSLMCFEIWHRRYMD